MEMEKVQKVSVRLDFVVSARAPIHEQYARGLVGAILGRAVDEARLPKMVVFSGSAVFRTPDPDAACWPVPDSGASALQAAVEVYTAVVGGECGGELLRKLDVLRARLVECGHLQEEIPR